MTIPPVSAPDDPAAIPAPGPPAAKPMILAPAGSQPAFLAALSAGADAIYCGLKSFSARMEARNFQIPELARLTELAHDMGRKVFVPLNVLLTPNDLPDMVRTIALLADMVRPDALIVQDLAMIRLAERAGFRGEIHLSTLANVTFPAALGWLRRTQSESVTTVVLPRELNVDEIRACHAALPAGLGLEVFVHGALCYGVSGRCYWSSYMGGKSGLRGRCVQPCRRMYDNAGKKSRLFSCQDLSLDVLVKVLLDLPGIRAWKIEGRKKGPHYVYYTTRAYQLLRDHFHDRQAKKDAVSLLERALGRPGTHYHFLPQRPQSPVNPEIPTGSGLLLGQVKGKGKFRYIESREALIAGDIVRLGAEDDDFHRIVRVGRHTPRGGKFTIPPGTGAPAPVGAPAFLTDRREPALIQRIDELERRLAPENDAPLRYRNPSIPLPKPLVSLPRPMDVRVGRHFLPGRGGEQSGCWISEESVKAAVSARLVRDVWWWLPPVIWPATQDRVAGLVRKLIEKTAPRFVLNAPWQISLFPEGGRKRDIWAGPFCNVANSLAVEQLARTGFSGAIASPELGMDDYVALASRSPLPLGVVIRGQWPMCVSRIHPPELPPGDVVESPKGERFWTAVHDGDLWLYPNWRLDFDPMKSRFMAAGYRMFVRLVEPIPKGLELKNRPGLWNLETGLDGRASTPSAAPAK